jgi:hypothetical protein
MDKPVNPRKLDKQSLSPQKTEVLEQPYLYTKMDVSRRKEL